MAEFRVQAAELLKKAEELESRNGDFKTMKDNLKGQEETLISMWEGDSRETFNTEFQKTAQNMENFYTGIMKYIVALREIVQIYERAESQNVETARR